MEREEQGDPIKEGKIRQSTNNPLPKDQKEVPAEDLVDDTTAEGDWILGKVIWPGKKKHTGKMLEVISKEDPHYLKGVLKHSYEVLSESDPELLKAVEWVVSKMNDNGKQDFKKGN
jgi:hypothetical protein